MTHFVLCDDNARHNQTLSILLSQLIEKQRLNAELACVTTQPQDVLRYAQASAGQTLYFLDLELEQETNGLDLCRQIRKADKQSLIIYVSAHQEYALQCCQSHAFDFLIKPFSAAQLEKSVMTALEELARVKPRYTLAVQSASRVYRLDQAEISHLDRNREYVIAQTLEGPITWRESFVQLLPRLYAPWFYQIHKGRIVNVLYIKEIDWVNETVTMKNGDKREMSRRIAKRLREDAAFCHAVSGEEPL